MTAKWTKGLPFVWESDVELDIDAIADVGKDIRELMDDALTQYSDQYCAGDYLKPVRFEGKDCRVIQIVMKPEKAPVVRGESLYRAVFNCEDLGLRVRAKNAREAERKMMVVFRHELTDKTINFRPEDYPAYDKEKSDGKETEDRPEGGRAEIRIAPLHPEPIDGEYWQFYCSFPKQGSPDMQIVAKTAQQAKDLLEDHLYNELDVHENLEDL